MSYLIEESLWKLLETLGTHKALLMVQLPVTIHNLLSWSKAALTSLTGRIGQGVSNAVAWENKTHKVHTEIHQSPCKMSVWQIIVIQAWKSVYYFFRNSSMNLLLTKFIKSFLLFYCSLNAALQTKKLHWLPDRTTTFLLMKYYNFWQACKQQTIFKALFVVYKEEVWMT